jgi:hypothetical protein
MPHLPNPHQNSTHRRYGRLIDHTEVLWVEVTPGGISVLDHHSLKFGALVMVLGHELILDAEKWWLGG